MVTNTQETKVKVGYKLTEVGVIPEDWEVKPLGDIASVGSGGTPSRLNSAYWNGTIPWVTTTQINFNLIDEADEFITIEGLENSSAKVCSPGTLLMAMIGQGKTRGKVAILTITAAINQNCSAIKPNKDIPIKYIFFNLSARYEELRNLSNAGNQGSLNATLIKSILVPFPKELKEPQAIATTLNDIDALLTSLDKLIAKKRDIKQATMQQLLTGKTRLPGFSGEWKVKRLGEIAEIVSGGTPSTNIAKFWNGNIKWCTPTDITRTKGKYLDNTEKNISEDGLKNSSANLLPIGSLLLCSRATIGEVKIATSTICTNQGFKSLVCSKEVNNEYLYYVMLTMKTKLIEKAIGSTFLEISKRDTTSLEISLPSLPEQTAIATILSDMDAEIAALEQKREKTRALKQGMMQELLTGRIRLL